VNSNRRSLLVTGGAGFIGANFLRWWRHRHPNDFIVALDALTYASNLLSLDELRESPEFEFVNGDIRDTPLVTDIMSRRGTDFIVHFAAGSHVARSISAPAAFIETNIVGTHSLLMAARSQWPPPSQPDAKRFHHVSTDEVYGSLGPSDPPFTEETPYAPNSPYAASKAAADHLVRAYNRTYGLPAVVTNCSNNYGPFQHPEKLIPLMILRALAGRELPVYGDGLNVRDWLYVEDHCRALELVLLHGQNGETYNIGGRSEVANIELVAKLCELVDEALTSDGRLREHYPASPASCGARTRELIRYVEDRPGHDRRYAIDASKVKRELGFVANESLDTGLRRTVDWYLRNEPWWHQLMGDNFEDWIRINYEYRGSGRKGEFRHDV